MVVKKGRYAELHENVPGKRGKKRFLRYLGILGRIDWSRMNGDGVDWYAIEQAELTRIKQDELAHDMYRDLQKLMFKEETGLDLPVNGSSDPVPVEKAPAQEKGPADIAEPAGFMPASLSEQPSPPSDAQASSETSASPPQGE